MSTAVKSPNPEPAHHYIVRRTVEACHMAKDAAAAAAEGIATGSNALLASLRLRERAKSITESPPPLPKSVLPRRANFLPA